MTDDTRIYDAICRHGGLTVRDLSDALRIPFEDVRKEVDYLARVITDTDGRRRGGTTSPPLIVFRDGGWHQNHQSANARTAEPPGPIVTIRRGPEGGRVNKRVAKKWVRR